MAVQRFSPVLYEVRVYTSVKAEGVIITLTTRRALGFCWAARRPASI